MSPTLTSRPTLSWRSGTLNRAPDNLVPLSIRPMIVDAIEQQIGRGTIVF